MGIGRGTRLPFEEINAIIIISRLSKSATQNWTIQGCNLDWHGQQARGFRKLFFHANFIYVSALECRVERAQPVCMPLGLANKMPLHTSEFWGKKRVSKQCSSENHDAAAFSLQIVVAMPLHTSKSWDSKRGSKQCSSAVATTQRHSLCKSRSYAQQ